MVKFVKTKLLIYKMPFFQSSLRLHEISNNIGNTGRHWSQFPTEGNWVEVEALYLLGGRWCFSDKKQIKTQSVSRVWSEARLESWICASWDSWVCLSQHQNILVRHRCKQDSTMYQKPANMTFWTCGDYNSTCFLYLLALCRAVGTGEPAFSMNYGRLQASIDRVEAIVTQSDRHWTY